MSRVNIDNEFIRRRTVEIQLRDSTPVLIRPIVPEDRDRLSEGLARLSPRSTQLRFLRSVGRFSERELSYLTEIDFKDHFAWGAMALDQPAEPGIGVARYVRDREDPETAEAAVAVIDAYQGRGLGSILLEVLAETAQENGIKRFYGIISSENRLVREAVRRAGASSVWEDGVFRFELPLPLPRGAEGLEGLCGSARRRPRRAGGLRGRPRLAPTLIGPGGVPVTWTRSHLAQAGSAPSRI